MRRALLLIFLLLPTTFCSICPKEFTLINGQKCVKLFRDPATHWEAERNCVAIGGTLATVKNAFDNRAILNFASDFNLNRIWLGLSCFSDSLSSCFWDDASGNLMKTFYSYFIPGNPSVKTGNCVVMEISRTLFGSYQGRWASENCNHLGNSTQVHPYFCEAPPTTESSSTLVTCPNNYMGSCYIKSQASGQVPLPKSSGTDASVTCQMMYKSNLTSIHSKMELDWIRHIYNGTNTTYIYIGAQSEITDRWGNQAKEENANNFRFEWIDGSKWDFDYMDPLNFKKGKCLVMDVQGDGLWSQVDCNQKFEFLCKQNISTGRSSVDEKLQKEPEILLDASNCNSTLYLAPGSISSFGYPDYNSLPTFCTWELRALGPYRLGIYFDFWATYGGLNIYDEFGTNIGQFIWPYSRVPFSRYTPFNIATVTFQPKPASGADVDRGFHAVVLPL